MPSFQKHCQDCKNELGEEFAEVNLWLDDLFATYGPNHRDYRHHSGGVEEVRAKWGDKAAQAAEIHIKADCHGKVPTQKEAELRLILFSGKKFI